MKRVLVMPEQEEKLYVRGDLLVLVDMEGIGTLYRTVETYVEPSEGIIEKWYYAEKPYHVDLETHLFRFLEQVYTCEVNDESDVEHLFNSMQPL